MLGRLLEVLGVYKAYEKWLWRQIKNGTMPFHIAVILDGNRRWARRKGFPPWFGHRKGAEKVKEFLRWCLDLNIKIVTLYVLSTENLKREANELNHLLNIIENYLKEALNDDTFDKYKVKFKAIGNIHLLPNRIKELISKLEEKTKLYDRYFLNVAIAYGGRAEIVEAVKRVIKDVQRGSLSLDSLDEEMFEKYLFTAHLPKPSPDLIIRTSGEERLSNFLLWQSAYSELCFLEVYWPEFRKIDLWRAIRIYQKRNRRFGK